MSKLHPIYDALRGDAFISSNKALRFAIGIHEADLYAELLSRHNYFSERKTLSEDGFFFNTVADLYQGTAISPKMQRPALKNLEKIGLIEMQLRGLPAKRYFKIIDDLDLLLKLLRNGREKAENAFIFNSSDKRSHLDMTKGHTNKNKLINGDSFSWIQDLIFDDSRCFAATKQPHSDKLKKATRNL